MAKIPPRTMASIDAARHAPKLPAVDSYYDKIHQATWIGRTSGLWAGAGLGTALGGTVGAVASYLPVLMGSGPAPEIGVLMGNAAVFASAGVMLGTVICADVGVTAAAVAAGFEEKERRDKLEKLRAVDPALAAEVEQAQIGPAQDAVSLSLPRRLWRGVSQAVDFKVMATGMVLGAAMGAILGAHPLAAGKVAELASAVLPGVQAGSGAAIAGAAAIFSMLGAVFGLKMSYLSNLVTNFSYNMLSGRLYGEKPLNTPEPEMERKTERAMARAEEASLPVPREACPPAREISYRQLIADQQCAHAALTRHIT